MYKFFITSLLLLWACVSFAQPYTQPQYGVSVEKNITYGTAKDFAGNDAELKLDIYKPVGNNDIERPIYLHFHGGSWLEISNKDQVEDAAICMEMAKKGYVAANVEYRRGYHRLNYYVPYALCGGVVFPNQSDCIYVQDTSEIVRAIYRGMQDAKSAIRFMKGRTAQDSTNANTVCIGGESAGGFIALYTGFLTCPDEKPAACYALPDAAGTDSDLADCNPATISLARPDLGSIEGTLNINGFDASVIGVANYYGGIMHPILQGPNPPALYLFHQTNDVVVDCNYKMPTQSFFEQVIYPLNLCQPLNTIPKAWGSCSIKNMLTAMGAAAPEFVAEIVNNGTPNSFANPPGHAYDNLTLRATQAATLFSPYITGQSQAPQGTNCTVSDYEVANGATGFLISPNPATDRLELTIPAIQKNTGAIRITDFYGKTMLQKQIELDAGKNTIGLNINLLPGFYLVTVEQAGKKTTGKLVVQ